MERGLTWLVAAYGVAAALIGVLGWAAGGWLGLAAVMGALVLAMTWAMIRSIPRDEEGSAAHYAAELTALSADVELEAGEDNDMVASLTDRLAS